MHVAINDPWRGCLRTRCTCGGESKKSHDSEFGLGKIHTYMEGFWSKSSIKLLLNACQENPKSSFYCVYFRGEQNRAILFVSRKVRMVRYISFDLASSALETFSANSSSDIRSFDCNFQLDALLAPSYFNQRRWGSL